MVFLHRLAVLTSVATWVLIWAGGLVTSTGSGLAVPDWPLSYGMLMPPLVGGILYEHSHRMVASLVGVLTTVLAIWLWRAEDRRWLRRLGFVALAMVILQGVLGGITVLYLLPTSISVSHATLAQTFFCLTVLIAFATSSEWREALPSADSSRPSLRLVAGLATLAVYLQLILGALMRHTGAGLAIPDFPLAFGRLIPPLSSGPVAIHFLHRLGAVAVAGSTAWLITRIARAHRQDRRFARPAMALAFLVVAQVLLGGATVWTQKAVLPATAHVAGGALLLATVWLITLRAQRHLQVQTGPVVPALPLQESREVLSR